MKKILGLILAISLIGQTVIPFNIAAAELTPDGATVLDVGDYLYFGEYNGSPVKYLVAAADDADGDGSDELLLISDKIIMRKNYSTDNYAIWSESTLRTYLNSNDETVDYPGGKAPDAAWVDSTRGTDYYQDQTAWDDEPGFLTNLTDFERNAIVPVTHKSVIHADDLARIGEGNYDGTEKHEWYSGSGSVWHDVWVTGGTWKQFYTNYDGGVDKNGTEHGEAYYQLTKDWFFIPSIKDGYDYDLPLTLPGNSLTAAYSNGASAFIDWQGGQQWMRDASAADNSQKKMFAKFLANQDMRSANVNTFANGVRPMFFIKANTPVKGSGTTDSPYVVAEALELSATVSGTTLSYTITNNTGASQSVVLNAASFTYTDGKESLVNLESGDITLSAGDNTGSFTIPAEADVVKLFITDASGVDLGVAPFVSGTESSDVISEAEADSTGIYIDEPSVSGKSVTIKGATPGDRFSYVNISLVKENGDGVAYKNQVIADEDGKFAVSFNVETLFGVAAEDADKIGGWYTLTVSSSEAVSAEARVGISDESVMLDVVDIFNDADGDKIAGILANDDAYLLEYSALPKDDMILSDVDTADISDLAEYICDNLPTGGYTKDNFATEFNKAAAAFLVVNAEEAEDKYEIIENKKYMEILGTEDFTKKTYYKDLKNEEVDIFNNLSVNIADDILENAILYLANNAESPEALMEIVEAEYAEIGVTLDADYNNIKKYPEILQNMYFDMMDSFEDYGDIVSAFNSAKAAALGDIPKGGTTTQKPIGSFGGGGGGGRVITVADPKVDEEDEEETSSDNAEDTSSDSGLPFNDIADLSYGIDAINRLFEDGVISGDGNGSFRPYDTVLREEYAKMFTLAFEISSDAEMPFEDVAPDAWYFPYIKNLYGAQIVKGISDTVFGVGQSLTRQDLAVMLYRYLGVEAKASEETFADDADISDYAREAVYTLSYIGIINGYDDGCFYPLNLATRQETAQLIWKTKNYIEYGSQVYIPGSTENQKPQYYDFLEILGVTLDTEKTFDDAITKSELVYLIMKGTNIGTGSAGAELTFRDVKADFWAYNEITAAANMGVVKGYTDDAFGINDYVASNDAAIMAMRAIGFSSSLSDAELRANFPGIYNNMLKNVENSTQMSVRDAYNLVYNMLNSKYPKLNIIGVEDVIRSIDEDSLFMESAFNVYKRTGRVEANQYTAVGISSKALSKGKVQIDGEIYSSDVDTADFIGLTVEYYLLDSDDDKIIYMIAEDNSPDEITISDDELIGVSKSGNNVLVEYELYGASKARTVSFPLNAVIIYNGSVTGYEAKLIQNLIDGGECGSVKIIEDNGNKIVRIDAYKTDVIKSVSTYTEEIIFESGKTVPFRDDGRDRYLAVFRNGEKCEPTDLQKDDIALIKENDDGNIITIEADDYYIEGTITAYTKDKYIQINNVPYEESNYFAKNITVKTGEKSRFYFDIFGKVAYMDSEDVTYDESYGFLAALVQSYDLDNTCKLLIYNLDGVLEELELPENVKFNGTKTASIDLAEGFANGTITNTIVYYGKNSDGEVVSFGTPQSGSNILSLDIPSQNRRYLTPFFANGTAETDLPLFYLDNDTVLITAPATDADKSDFRDENNYNVTTAKSYFRDYKQYVVEAYNLNDFNVAEYIVLRDSASSTEEPSDTSQMVVTNIAESIGDDGYEQLVIEGMSGSGEVSIALKEESFGYYTDANGQTAAFKRGDIIKYAVNNRGLCNYTSYVGTIYNIDRTGSYSGKTNSQNFLASGTVRDAEGSYLKIAFGDGTETILYGLNTISAIICDSASDKIFIGSVDDIQSGDFVYTRSGYSYLKEIFVIK